MARDDDDDEPRPKKKRSEDDDEPPRKKKRSDDEEGSSSKGKKKKKAGINMLWVGLGAGGVLLLLLCCGGGIGVYFLFPQGDQSLIGRWENKGGNIGGFQFNQAYIFRADGTATKEDSNVGKAVTNFKYRIEDGSPRVIVISHPPIEMVMPGGKKMVLQGARDERIKFRIRRDVLTMTHNDMGGDFDLTYNRAK